MVEETQSAKVAASPEAPVGPEVTASPEVAADSEIAASPDAPVALETKASPKTTGSSKAKRNGKASRRKHTTAKKSARYGTTLRKAVPRDVLSAWKLASKRPPVSDAGGANGGFATPYDLFAARAQSMAYDISSLPMTGIEVQLCGDARVDNFGLFSVPGGAVVCDLYDFTYTVRGPWEWDVARLATSIELALRQREVPAKKRREVVADTVRKYRMAMRSFADRATMDVWLAQRDSAALAKRIGENPVDGAWWLGDESPADSADRKVVSAILDQYYQTLKPEWRRFVSRCTMTDVVRLDASSDSRVAWAVTLEGARPSDYVTLLVEEAQESAIQRFVGKAPQPSHGHRVVDGQRAMQAVNDVLLGWATVVDGHDVMHSYYVRSLWPKACELDVRSLGPGKMKAFAKTCAWTIAHAHARTGNRFAIAAYLGGADKFDQAACDFARLYAAQCERDFR